MGSAERIFLLTAIVCAWAFLICPTTLRPRNRPRGQGPKPGNVSRSWPSPPPGRPDRIIVAIH